MESLKKATLIDFAIYYRQQFQQDLLHFVEKIPIDGNKHYKKQEFSIQYFFLTPNYSYLNVVPADRQALFAIALFWTILVDQTVYSNYRYDYLTFQRKTRYPKFIGNCTAPSLMSSQCGHHQHPKRILDAINDFGDVGNLLDFDREIFKKDETTIKRTKVEFGDLLEKSKLTMKIEIKEYFENHHPTIDWTGFWDKCELEM